MNSAFMAKPAPDLEMQKRVGENLALARGRRSQREIAAEASRRTADVVVVLKHSEETYAESSVEDQQRIVRTVSIALGGLCSEADGTLTARRPVDAGSRVRPRLAKSR
jgi:hypothetical protein